MTTHRIADNVARFAQPVAEISEHDGRELADPDGQQTGVEDQSVGDRHHHQEKVCGKLEHRLVFEDDECEDVAERSEDDDERRNVQLQQPMRSVLFQLCHLLHHTVSQHTIFRRLKQEAQLSLG